jgi:hypothetical protein
MCVIYIYICISMCVCVCVCVCVCLCLCVCARVDVDWQSKHVCVFITAVPITKLFAWGEGDSGGHVLRETTSRGLSGLVCPSRTSERGGILCERRRRRRGAREGLRVFITAVLQCVFSTLPPESCSRRLCVCVCVCLLLQYLLQSCSRGGRGIVEDMCYERRRADALVD